MTSTAWPAKTEQCLQPGDRVDAYLPNIPEAMVAFLAVVSLGGIWSICAPDMGTAAVLDRFQQIEPVVLIATDRVTYGGRTLDRSAVVAELCAGLPSVRHVILHTTQITPESIANQTGSRSRPVAAASSKAAATRPSTATACAWAPASRTAVQRE